MVNICIIGAGPSGLSALKAFTAHLPNATIVCYEKQAQPGGLWNPSWQQGTDNFGEQIHSAQYKHLYKNAPSENYEYPDYSYEQHFGKAIGSYPPGFMFREYLLARHSDPEITEKIKLRHSIKRVRFSNDKFEVTVKNLTENRTFTEVFDFCVVATGHFSSPFNPIYPGIEKFEGIAMHAKEFKSAKSFENKTVLTIGSSYSSEDIAMNCLKFGAKKAFLGYRKKPDAHLWNAIKFPEKCIRKGEIREFHENSVTFTDGSTEEIDAVIFCTGYRHDFPFMDPELNTFSRNRWFVDNLYQNTVFLKNPKLFYMGMMDQVLSTIMFDVQAHLVAKFISGEVKIPDFEIMKESYVQDQQLEDDTAPENIPGIIDNQFNMVKKWIEMCGYPHSFNFDLMKENYLGWGGAKCVDVTTFRDKSYTNIYTGKPSPTIKTPYMNLTVYDKNQWLDQLVELDN